jgi:hypothetical protein
MGQLQIDGSRLGNSLLTLLTCEEIEPGDQPSYELCKTIWLYHPLGGKMVDAPIKMAQSQTREISVPNSPEARVRDQFVKEWKAIGANDHIRNVAATARAYGIASIAILADGVPADKPIDMKKIADLSISFSTFDPLNTAGSLVLNQDPNAMDFQKVTTIAVSGVPYHRSRAITIMHERPVYIAYTGSAFGFVGRSVFQRGLFPLKSFVQSMVTDDLVTKKAGVFIATLKVAGAIINAAMQAASGIKRLFVREATNGNVISIGIDEKIETLNMQNIDGAYGMARQNILENIATSADMPAIVLKQETYAEGFGEGTEDAKLVAGFVDGIREWLNPLYVFFDRIVMYRAWNRDFYAIIQEDFPKYRTVPYEQAFFEWQNSFSATWPSLLTEPESEKVKTDDVKLKALIATVEVLMPELDPENKGRVVQFLQDNINENKRMFTSPLDIDFDALAEYVPPAPLEEQKPQKPFAATDSQSRKARAVARYDESVGDLFDTLAAKNVARTAKPNGAMNGHANGKGIRTS